MFLEKQIFVLMPWLGRVYLKSQPENFAVYDAPPSFDINSYVISDTNGLYYSRLTTVTLAILAS